MPGSPYTGFWLSIMVVLIIIEAFTLGLTTIWFAVGAFLAWIGSLLNLSVYLQAAIFIITSVGLLLSTGPIARKYLKIGHTRTNSDRYVGEIGVVIEKIDPIEGTGQVMIGGKVWSAKSAEDIKICKGDMVLVKEISGVKLIVTPENKKDDKEV